MVRAFLNQNSTRNLPERDWLSRPAPNAGIEKLRGLANIGKLFD